MTEEMKRTVKRRKGRGMEEIMSKKRNENKR